MRAERLLLLCLGTTVACATTRVERAQVTSRAAVVGPVVVERSRAEAWAKGVPCLAARLFVETSDAASGLLTVSYAGPAEKYLDGGTVTIELVPADRDEPHPTSRFPAAAARQEFTMAVDGARIVVTREIALEARVNVVIEPAGATATRVTPKPRFTVTRTLSRSNPEFPRPFRIVDAVPFGPGEPGRLAEPNDVFLSRLGPDVFWSKGQLEREILSCFAE